MGQTPRVRHYDAQYGQFASELYAGIRRAAFGQDIGQNGWLTAEEHDLFIRWLDLSESSSLVDIACGSGGTTLRIAQITGCRVQGLDLHEQGVATATAAARSSVSRIALHFASGTPQRNSLMPATPLTG